MACVLLLLPWRMPLAVRTEPQIDRHPPERQLPRAAAVLLAIALAPLLSPGTPPAGAQEVLMIEQRQRMVETQIVSRGVSQPEVLSAMRTVPRHLFVPEALRRQAYEDYPLPIGAQQTISQPYIVALMTELLDLEGRREGARDRHRLRLPGGGAVARRRRGLHHRDPRAAGPAGPTPRSTDSATRTSTSASATATRAGPRRRRSTPSSSPPRRSRSRSRCSISSRSAGAW